MGGGRGKAGASGRNRHAAAGDGRSGDRGGSLELGHEREGEEEEGKSRTAPGDDKDAWLAEMRALLTGGQKSGGTGFQSRWHRFWPVRQNFFSN